jgi:uncharacterized protein (TIGR02246 family)
MATRKPPPAALHASVDEVEAQFYEALQQGDIERLMALWADDEECVCVHPGGPRLIGPSAIRASFEAIFANGGIPVQPEQQHRLHTPHSAVHHLAERITVSSADGAQTAWVLCTNVYLKTPQGWRIVAHHASPGSLEPPAPAAPASGATLH